MVAFFLEDRVHSRVVPGLNLGMEKGYSDRVLLWLFSVSPEE
jgi:hypothetical protein